jgi:hypothetical protein
MGFFYLHIKDDDKIIATKELTQEDFNSIDGDGAQFIINAYQKFFNLDISDYDLRNLILEDGLVIKNKITIKINKSDLVIIQRDIKLGDILNG